MTAGHKHRKVRVKRGGILHRLLTRTLCTTCDIDWVEQSRMVFGPVEGDSNTWRLTPLGILHGWTGLTLEVRDERAG